MHFAIAEAAHLGSRMPSDFRRFALALAAFTVLPPLLIAAFIIAVDPAFVFGSPSWPDVNAVRPYYEGRVLVAKPYQVRRRRPAAVALGSSRVEVGIDPRHPGWIDTNAFNFAMPWSNSYAVMLAFLHAQRVGAPLKQAVVGLDFFGYNINFDLGAEILEARFADGISSEFAQFLDERLASDAKPSTPAAPAIAIPPANPAWNEALYLAVNPDVAAAIARKEFASGREHYDRIGRTQRRDGGSVPADWDEIGYRQVNPDVAQAIAGGWFLSGYHQYLVVGRSQGRLGGFQPADWNEGRYLAANPDARNRLAQGTYRTGYLHYVGIGLSQGLAGGLPPRGLADWLRLRWPTLSGPMFKLHEGFSLVLSRSSARDAVGTVLRQSQAATFDDLGVRVWHGHEGSCAGWEDLPRCSAGMLAAGSWYPTLAPPTLVYCFANPRTGVSTFDSFRFMLRRAYAQGTDLRLYVTPLHAAMRELLVALGLGERYEFWLRELVRINEQEAARAGGRRCRFGISATPTPSPANRFPRRRRFPDAMVLGVFALPQGHRRSDSRSHLRTTPIPRASCRRFRRAADRRQHRRAYRRAANPSSRTGPPPTPNWRPDRRRGPAAELAEPPGRGDLLVGRNSTYRRSAVASLVGPRDLRVRTNGCEGTR